MTQSKKEKHAETKIFIVILLKLYKMYCLKKKNVVKLQCIIHNGGLYEYGR